MSLEFRGEVCLGCYFLNHQCMYDIKSQGTGGDQSGMMRTNTLKQFLVCEKLSVKFGLVIFIVISDILN